MNKSGPERLTGEPSLNAQVAFNLLRQSRRPPASGSAPKAVRRRVLCGARASAPSVHGAAFATRADHYDYFATKHRNAPSLPGSILQRGPQLASSSFSASSSTLMSAGLVPGPPAKCPHSVSTTCSLALGRCLTSNSLSAGALYGEDSSHVAARKVEGRCQ